MDRRHTLAMVSAAQLASGMVAMTVALRRRHPFDLPLLSGDPGRIHRDCIVMGTALSAPVVMLAAQAAAIGVLMRHSSRTATRALSGLGAAMVPGYLLERHVRRRLRVTGWDGVESPLIVVGMGLAGVMAVLGRPVAPRPPFEHKREEVSYEAGDRSSEHRPVR